MIRQKSAKCDRRVWRVPVTLENAFLEKKHSVTNVTSVTLWPVYNCDQCYWSHNWVTNVTQFCDPVTHVSNEEKNTTWPRDPCDPVSQKKMLPEITKCHLCLWFLIMLLIFCVSFAPKIGQKKNSFIIARPLIRPILPILADLSVCWRETSLLCGV